MTAYFIKVILCSGILYLYYLLALRNKKFHRYNRFYLLSAVVFSFLIPLLNVDVFIHNDNERIGKLLALLYANQPAERVVLTDTAQSISWETVVYVTVAFASVFLLAIAFLRIVKIMRLKKHYRVERIDDVDFMNTSLQEAPFSFFRNLFWRRDISLEEEAGIQIMRHEMAHIRQKHSWDRLFLQTVKAVCWFNPVYYFMEKELILIHEYMADEEAIASKDGRAFAAMLLRSQISSFSYTPGQAIFYSSIKKRLKMLTQNQKTKFSYARRLMVLPLLGCVVLLFAFRANHTETAETIKMLETQVALQAAQSADTLPLVRGQAVVLRNSNTSDSASQLKGKVSGITVITADTVMVTEDGRPFATVQGKGPLKIVSTKSTEGKPLILIDGQPLPEDAAMNKAIKNPADIESINIIKDAAATVKYGDRGKYGVVEITTKKNAPAQQGKAKELKKVKGEGASSLTLKAKGKNGLPLYVVDGKPVDRVMGMDKVNINADDIESINILKEGSATSLYGEKGKYGVILVTTRKGMSNKKIAPDASEKHEIVFTTLQQQATYPGNWQAFLKANQNADIVVDKQGPPGTYKVTVSFMVDEEGNVSQVKALNDPGYGTAAEAVRLIQKSGKWNPGKQNGNKVKSLQKKTFIWIVE